MEVILQFPFDFLLDVFYRGRALFNYFVEVEWLRDWRRYEVLLLMHRLILYRGGSAHLFRHGRLHIELMMDRANQLEEVGLRVPAA